MFRSSVDALAQALLEEYQRGEDNSRHNAIRISCVARYLENGLKRCSVQVECEAGCGWLVEASAEQADLLQQKAIAIHGLLHGDIEVDPKSLSEILNVVFPESAIEARLPMGTNTKELFA